MDKELNPKPHEALKRRNEENRLMEVRDALIEEGRNQVLYLLLCIGDENVLHDNWHPDKADFLYEVRREIVSRLRTRQTWPTEASGGWPDFEQYTYTPG